MKAPNGYGSICKLSGTRRRPYMVQITTSYEVDEETCTVKRKRATIGYYATRKEAMLALAEYHNRPINPERATFGEVWQKVYDRMELSHDRMTAYKAIYARYFSSVNNLTFNEIKAVELQNIVDKCELKSSTKTLIVAIMHKTYDYAIANNYTSFDCSKYVHYKQDKVEIKRKIFSSEEVAELWNDTVNIYSIFTLLLLYSGCRIKELRDLKREDVFLSEHYFKIRQAKNETSVRTVPIHPKVLPLWENILQNCQNEHLFEFRKNQYDYFAKETLRHTPYDTRHTFATRCNELGIDKLIIQRIMGHKPDSVLEQTYTHLSIERLCTEVEKLKY